MLKMINMMKMMEMEFKFKVPKFWKFLLLQ